MNFRYCSLLFALCMLLSCSVYQDIIETTTSDPAVGYGAELSIAISTTGNTWALENGTFTSSERITPEGISSWLNSNNRFRTYFYLDQAGDISLGIRARVHSGVSRLKVNLVMERETQVMEYSETVSLQETNFTDTHIGNFRVEQSGYYYVEISGLEKSGSVFADISDLLIGGVRSENVKYIKDDFYFGRRGPSVHLNFPPPDGVDQVEWFYSELTIPQGEDVIGSYFMANGFGEGYFGIQVNSPSERKILFSIWSPYKTDNPDDIPEDQRIKLLKKGQGVVTGEFGNEGSGGQSYKVFNWKTDVNYGFLVGAKPLGDGNTDYTAYFHDPETGHWDLIAQFRRPKTTTYLKHLYSFLENFIPHTGVLERKCLYHNQWLYDASSGWHELTEVTFTADNTARKEYRLDYSGGVEGDGFYLKNCGFTTDIVSIDSRFSRPVGGRKPNVDFGLLE